MNSPNINILFPTGITKNYKIKSDTTVNDLVGLIADDQTVEKPADRSIVVIYHGKILQSNQILSKIDTLSEFTVHIFFRKIIQNPNCFRNADNKDEVSAQSEQETLDITNSSVNRIENDLSEDLRGFDRLVRMNYTQRQIQKLRKRFHRLQNTENVDPEEQIDMEEEWFPVLFNTNVIGEDGSPASIRALLGQVENYDPHSNPLVTPNQVYEEGDLRVTQDVNVEESQDTSTSWGKFIIGIFIGLIFGFASFLFMAMFHHNKSMLAGIFIGLVAHCFFSSFFF